MYIRSNQYIGMNKQGTERGGRETDGKETVRERRRGGTAEEDGRRGRRGRGGGES